MHVVEGLSLLLYVGVLDELGQVLLIDAYAEGAQKECQELCPYELVAHEHRVSHTLEGGWG